MLLSYKSFKYFKFNNNKNRFISNLCIILNAILANDRSNRIEIMLNFVPCIFSDIHIFYCFVFLNERDLPIFISFIISFH